MENVRKWFSKISGGWGGGIPSDSPRKKASSANEMVCALLKIPGYAPGLGKNVAVEAFEQGSLKLFEL